MLTEKQKLIKSMLRPSDTSKIIQKSSISRTRVYTELTGETKMYPVIWDFAIEVLIENRKAEIERDKQKAKNIKEEIKELKKLY